MGIQEEKLLEESHLETAMATLVPPIEFNSSGAGSDLLAVLVKHIVVSMGMRKVKEAVATASVTPAEVTSAKVRPGDMLAADSAVPLEKGKDAEEGSMHSTDEEKIKTSKEERGANDCHKRVQGSDSEEKERSGDGMSSKAANTEEKFDPKRRRTDGDNSDQVKRSQPLSPLPAQAASLSRGSPLQTPVEQQNKDASLPQNNNTSQTPVLHSGQATASAGNAYVVFALESKA